MHTRTQALCSLNEMYVEWHDSSFALRHLRLSAKKQGLAPEAAGSGATLGLIRATRSFLYALTVRGHVASNLTTGDANVTVHAFGDGRRDLPHDCLLQRVHEQDDETYLHDVKQWPGHSVCASHVSPHARAAMRAAGHTRGKFNLSLPPQGDLS